MRKFLCWLGFHKWRYTQPWQTIGEPCTQVCVRKDCDAMRSGIFYIERF